MDEPRRLELDPHDRRVSADLLTDCLDQFRMTALRLETRTAYHDDDPDDGPPPVRSIRTNRYLERIARTTLDGKTWRRLRVVDDPPTPYQREQLDAYRESQAVGEIIDMVPRAVLPDGLDDVWLFDAEGARPFALHLGIAPNGAPDLTRDELLTNPADVADLSRRLAELEQHAVPLNEYVHELAHRGR